MGLLVTKLLVSHGLPWPPCRHSNTAGTVTDFNAFITGNTNLEPLLEVLLAPIQIDLSSLFFSFPSPSHM